MKTELLDLDSLERLISRHTGTTGNPGSIDEPEHPLARELRSVLTNKDAHKVGDLARVVESILREMSMIKSDMTSGSGSSN